MPPPSRWRCYGTPAANIKHQQFKNNSMKIYVASSWRNPIQQSVVSALRLDGHEVYDFKNPAPNNTGFQWSAIDPDWQNWTSEQYREALKHPIAEAGFKLDFDAMKWAEVCVMVLPCGRSANTEAGWMKGAGKYVIVYQNDKQEPELMYKMHDGIATNMSELRIAIMRIDDLPFK